MNAGSWFFFGLSAIGVAVLMAELICLRLVSGRRTLSPPARWPSVSILKPLCGLDDELEQNLESHAQIDYPGAWEIILGVRSANDAAHAVALRFAERYPERVRVVLQDNEAGHNPKVNQLITLTRAAKHEVLSVTDSNVRVPRTFLREIAAVLEEPGVGVATNVFNGSGERRWGAALDNQTLTLFVAPSLAAGQLLFGMDVVVGKSMALRRDTLERLGGWHSVKDKLAEDSQLSSAIHALGLHAGYCPTPVSNVQIHQDFGAFWKRQTRWLMIRHRNFFPVVLGEIFCVPTLWALIGALLSPTDVGAWRLFGLTWFYVAMVLQACAQYLGRRGFAVKHLLLVPIREAAFFAAWLRGATLRSVEWRGHRLHVLHETRLAPPEVLARARNIHRLSRF